MAADAAELYKDDFYAWTKAQAEALRRLAAEQWNGPLDLDRLAGEVEDLGSSERHAVESQIERVIEHFLKLEFSSSAESRRQWLVSVFSARDHLAKRMTSSLRAEVKAELPDLYRRGRRKAELGLWDYGEIDSAATLLPKTCPYSFDSLVDENWLPANQHGLTDPEF